MLCNELEKDCGFISAELLPRGDSFGADTVVELTPEQVFYYNKIPDYEKNSKRIASHLAASDALRGGNFCREPVITYNGNAIKFTGSALAAEYFFRHFFRSPS